MKRVLPVLVVLSVLGWAALAVSAAPKSKPGGVQFGQPVEITPELGYGYEPSVVVDRFGNIFSTAHKENWQLVIGPDVRSPTLTRSMSWDWWSVDGGTTWDNIPGFPLQVENKDFGDEGDMAIDDADHLYFVDTAVHDVTFTRWTIQGPGEISIDFHRPVLPAGEPVDDRPWVSAQGDGHVYYLGNEGDKETYPLGQGREGANGPGRYTVYTSHDGGLTFDVLGYTLDDSGWCRPAAEHGADPSYLYVLCTNDEGKLYSYVSNDFGETFNRYDMGRYHPFDFESWPTVEVAPDGSVWALFIDAEFARNQRGQGKVLVGNRLILFHSADHGRTWQQKDITPVSGFYEYQWLSVSPDGKALGLAVYYRPDRDSDWFVYGAIFQPGQKPHLVSLAPDNPVQSKKCEEAPGDYLMSDFNPDGTLNAVWTDNTTSELRCGLVALREIWFARSRS